MWAFLWTGLWDKVLPAVVVRPARVARATGVQEKEGQGRVPPGMGFSPLTAPWDSPDVTQVLSGVGYRTLSQVPGKETSSLAQEGLSNVWSCAQAPRQAQERLAPSCSCCQGLSHDPAVLFLASEGTSLAVQLRVLVGGALSEKLVGGAHAPPLPTGGVPIPSSRRETKGREGLGESPRCGGPSKGGHL